MPVAEVVEGAGEDIMEVCGVRSFLASGDG